MKTARCLSARCVCATMLCCVSSLAWGASYTKIADKNTPVPGGGATFTGFDKPAFDGTNAAFYAYLSNNTYGVYRWNGSSLAKIAVTGDTAPGGATFTNLSTPTIDAGKVAFSANLSVANNKGIFSDVTGTLQRTIDMNATVPPTGASYYYSGLGYIPSISAGSIAFDCTISPFPQGPSICLTPNTLVTGYHTTMPGGGGAIFGNVLEPIKDGSAILYYGHDSSATLFGLYLSNGGSSVVVDSNVAIPGGSGDFTDFRSYDIDGTDVCFYGLGMSGYGGLFLKSGGITKIADTNTNAPDGGKFTIFGYGSGNGPAVQDGAVVFCADTTLHGSGLYTTYGGTLQKLLAPGDTIDGQTVSACYLSPNSFRGTKFTVYVITNTNAVLYLVDLEGSTGGCGAKQLLDVAKPLNPLTPLKKLLPGRFAAADWTERVLADLRRFRDSVMEPSQTGRQLIQAYYTHSAAVATAAISRPDLLIEGVRLLEEVHQSVAAATAADPVVRLPRTTYERGLAWLDAVEPLLAPPTRQQVADARAALQSISENEGNFTLVRFVDRSRTTSLGGPGTGP